jgi:hypothetical protein
MKKLLTIAKWFLIIWGGLSLIGVLSVGGFLAYQLGPGNRAKINTASREDVRFVLNWCDLGDQRIEKVVASFVSHRSFTGDHHDAYAIKVTHLSIEELTASADDFRERWYRGDQLPKVVDDAVSFVGTSRNSDEIPWFPSEAELRSSEVYVYPCTIYYHGTRPSAAEIIFVRPGDKMVFYFSEKT